MLLITLEAAKAIRAERCSPMEKTGQDLQLARHTDPLGRAKGLDASPHCFTLFNQDNPSTRQTQVKGQTLSIDTKPQAHGADFSQQPPSCFANPHASPPPRHPAHEITGQEQGPRTPPKPDGHRRPLNSGWCLPAALLSKHPPWQAERILQTSGHSTVLKNRRKSQEDQLQGSDLAFSPYF